MAIVWKLARAGGHFAMENMLLAGFAIGTMLNAATSALSCGRSQPIRARAFWRRGCTAEITVPSWTQLSCVAVAEVAVLLLALPLARSAEHAGAFRRVRRAAGCARRSPAHSGGGVGLAAYRAGGLAGGLIGFVGLLVPHFLRLILGPDHFRLLPASALCGALFLIVANTIARTAFAPSEIPVGMLTAFLGAPAFLYLLNHRPRSASL